MFLASREYTKAPTIASMTAFLKYFLCFFFILFKLSTISTLCIPCPTHLVSSFQASFAHIVSTNKCCDVSIALLLQSVRVSSSQVSYLNMVTLKTKVGIAGFAVAICNSLLRDSLLKEYSDIKKTYEVVKKMAQNEREASEKRREVCEKWEKWNTMKKELEADDDFEFF